MRRFKVKYLRSKKYYVVHTKTKKGWRRLWAYVFFLESDARKFAEGNF